MNEETYELYDEQQILYPLWYPTLIPLTLLTCNTTIVKYRNSTNAAAGRGSRSVQNLVAFFQKIALAKLVILASVYT
jgi:hypothetical protein